jgi:diguanylate cyclase (GGDEF)-like protein
MPAYLIHLRDLLLGSDATQQRRMKVWGASAVGYVLYSLVQMLEVSFGQLGRESSDALIAAMAINTLFFYGLYRSGLNRRLGHDAGLTLVQILIGCVLSLWSYAVTGPARGAILLILASTLMYGVFSLSPRQSRMLVGAALAGLAGVMAWCTMRETAPYPWRLELVHFLFATIVMWTMAVLAGQLGALRLRLSRQKNELKQAMGQLQRLATRDELTQIHNRRHMTELMDIEARQHARSGAPLCLALLDIDFFKGINDRFGHAAGDKVLQHFAAQAVDTLRSSDLLARWGGEEFLVLFPDTPIELAEVALARLHERLRVRSLECLHGQPITFSAGLTAWDPGEPMESTTERADQAMYRAKTGGRDRTTVLSRGAPVPASERDIVGISPAAPDPAVAPHWQ